MYRLFIDQIPAETRIALMQGEQLCALHIDRTDMSDYGSVKAGNIYWGRVVNIVPALQAAFIDIGQGQNGFLPAKTLGSDDISKAVQDGQYLRVQVRKEPQEDKGPLLSARIELPSPDCLFTPMAPGIHVSRKIKDEETRNQLLDTLRTHLPPDTGLIIRTSAQDKPVADILAQAQELQQTWQTLANRPAQRPALLHQNDDFITAILQRYEQLDLASALVEGVDALHRLQQGGADATLYSGSTPLFDAHGINAQIEQALYNEVPLPGGGSIVIERTKALIAVDVNMGTRQHGRDSDANRLEINLAALDALHAQLDLRNLSGQILVDFLRLKSPKQRSRLREACNQVLGQDGRCHIHGFTRMGLLELSRKRQGYALDELCSDPQSACLALIRKLAYLPRCQHLHMGARLHRLWTSPALADSRSWLEQRLGFCPSADIDHSLPPLTYKLDE